MTFSVCIPIPMTEQFRSHWDHVRAHFKVDNLYVLGDGKTKTLNDLPLKPLISIEASGDILLEDFTHPEDGIYLFGPDDYPMPREMLDRKPDHFVRIPTFTQRFMFSFVAFSVVAWDRRMKLK